MLSGLSKGITNTLQERKEKEIEMKISEISPSKMTEEEKGYYQRKLYREAEEISEKITYQI